MAVRAKPQDHRGASAFEKYLINATSLHSPANLGWTTILTVATKGTTQRTGIAKAMVPSLAGSMREAEAR